MMSPLLKTILKSYSDKLGASIRYMEIGFTAFLQDRKVDTTDSLQSPHIKNTYVLNFRRVFRFRHF